jgi:hypothetical protein
MCYLPYIMEILRDFVRLIFGISEDKEVTNNEVFFALGGIVFLIVVLFGVMK